MSPHHLELPTVPCRLCDKPTIMTGTKLCDRCWELESRIYHNPELAQKILTNLRKGAS